jgi:molybdate transport system permease protein
MFAGNFPGRTQTLSLAVMSAMQSDLDTAVAISVLALGLGVLALFATRWAVRRSGLTGV